MSTHLMCTGGRPHRYQTAVSDVISRMRAGPSFHSTETRHQNTLGLSRSSMGEGSRFPFRRGLPICLGSLGGAGSKSAASSLSLLMNVTGWRRDWQLCRSSSAAYPMSVTTTMRRSGSQVEDGSVPVGVMLPTEGRGGEWHSYPEAQLRIGSSEVADVPMDRIPSVLKRMLGEFAESVGADDIPTLMLFDALNVRRFWPESQNRNLTVGSGVGMTWDTGGLRPRVARTHASGDAMP